MIKGGTSMKISIITATYNVEKTIRQTIESVQSQTYREIEYIIIDGLSTDSTLEIAREYENVVDTIISEKDYGVYDAFNKGLRIATGDIIYFLNADDYLVQSEVIEDVMNQFISHPQVYILYGNVYWLYENNLLIKDNHCITKKRLENGFICPHQGTFYRKSYLEKVNGFNTTYKLVADAEIVISLFLTEPEKIYFFDRFIAAFRAGGVSTHANSRKLLINEKTAQIKQYFGVKKAISYKCKQNVHLFQYKLYILYKALKNVIMNKRGIKNG